MPMVCRPRRWSSTAWSVNGQSIRVLRSVFLRSSALLALYDFQSRSDFGIYPDRPSLPSHRIAYTSFLPLKRLRKRESRPFIWSETDWDWASGLECSSIEYAALGPLAVGIEMLCSASARRNRVFSSLSRRHSARAERSRLICGSASVIGLVVSLSGTFSEPMRDAQSSTQPTAIRS